MHNIKSCLYNLSLDENNNTSVTDVQTAYYKGLIIGIVSTLLDRGFSFDRALKVIEVNLPDKHLSLHMILSDWFKG